MPMIWHGASITARLGEIEFFVFFFVGGRSPPTPPEMRKGHAAMPRGPFAWHEVGRLSVVVFGLFVGLGVGFLFL